MVVGYLLTTLPLLSTSTTVALLPALRSSDTSNEVWPSSSISFGLLTSDEDGSAMLERMSAIKPAAEDRPRIPVKIEEFLAATAMALICLITFANVLVRYLTDESFAFTEEFSVFLMVVLTFVGASAAFAKNSHIRMSFLVEKLPLRIAHRIEIAMMVAAAVLFDFLFFRGHS